MRLRNFSLTLACAIALAACGKKEEAAAPAGPPPAAVTTAPASVRSVTEAQEFPARLEAVEAVAVRSRITGYIQDIHFAQGEDVRKGDLLVTIDPRPILSAH